MCWILHNILKIRRFLWQSSCLNEITEGRKGKEGEGERKTWTTKNDLNSAILCVDKEGSQGNLSLLQSWCLNCTMADCCPVAK